MDGVVTTDRNVVLTGVPRSGTTLVCHLLNRLPQTVALNEPMQVHRLAELDAVGSRCDEVARFFGETRRALLAHGDAPSRHVGGRVPDDVFADSRPPDGLRRDRAARGVIRVEKALSVDFLLCVKHPAAFTALLESLAARFPAYAVIRNPLAVLASWQSIDANVHRGSAPVAERLDPGLSTRLRTLKDPDSRQLGLLDWFFAKYRDALPPTRVLQYENVVASGGSALAPITPAAAQLAEPLASRNLNDLYDRARMRVLGEKLLASEGAYWTFYSRESVEALLRQAPRSETPSRYRRWRWWPGRG